MNFYKAFSLVELMVVIAIIGILSAIAIPSYKTYVTKAKLNGSIVMLEAFKKTVEHYYNINNKYPSTVDNIGYARGGIINGTNGLSTNALNTDVVGEIGLYSGNCSNTNKACIWVGIYASIIETSQPGIIGMTFTDNNGIIQWSCYTPSGVNSVPLKFLNSNCQVVP